MIVLVDNYDSFTYNLYQLLSALDEVVVLRNDVATIDRVASYAPTHLVISPGPGRPKDAGHCIALIKHFSVQGLPILGVCLGHQSIVEAFGGEVVLSDVPVHGKSTEIHHQREGLYTDMPQPFQAGRYHSLVAAEQSLPDTLIVDAKNDDDIVMGCRHRELPVYGLQFHPESILTPEGTRLIRSFVQCT